MLKKVIAALLVIVMSISICACSGKTETNAGQSEEIPETLTIFSSLGSTASKVCETNNDILGFQLLEELTGCHVEWIHPTKGADIEKFNLMIASGELPDVICYDWSVVSGGARSYAEDGFIIPLTDMVDKYMPNLKAYNEANPEVKKQYSDDEGDIYYIPFIRGDEELKVYLGPVMRTDWLEKLGLSVPETTDDLYNVLKAFKTQDPNGNGKADEVPMTGVKFKNTSHGIGNLLWAFGTHYDFYREGNTVKYGIMEERFEEGLKYITNLFSEGLIDPDYLLIDRTKMTSKVKAEEAGFLYGFQPSSIMTSMESVNPEFKWEGIPHITGPYGDQNCYMADYYKDLGYASVAITTANKSPIGTAKWLDNFYGGKGLEYMNFGKEGLSFNYVDGEPILSDYILNNPDGKDISTMRTLSIAAAESSFPMLQDWRYYKQTLHKKGEEAINTWVESAEIDGIMPSVSLTAEEQGTVSKIMAQVDTYADEQINRIVIGEGSMEDLPQIREKIKGMGIDEVISIYQAALDRYNKR